MPKVVLTLLILIAVTFGVCGLFRMTKVECESYNKTWVVVNECRLRAVSREVTTFNMNITFHYPAYDIGLSQAMVKRANGYKPFLFNLTFNACEYVKRPNHPMANIIFKLFKEFSNINHSCPYVGDQLLRGFYLKENMLIVPLPNGEYGLLMNWILHKKKVFVTNVYFEVKRKE